MAASRLHGRQFGTLAASILSIWVVGLVAEVGFTGGWVRSGTRCPKSRSCASGQEEGQSLETIFANIDHDKDGKIDASELLQGCQSLGDEFDKVTAAEASELFAMIDVDGDGLMSFEEFVRWYMKMNWTLPKFRAADKDGNGRITLEEWMSFQAPFGRLWTKETALLLFDQADADDDGAISIVEYMKMNS
eukprot:TRINITY_DN26834_c0_g1_i1.p1 TRINITY_DN26834_c0_g1~~TRINITY_DN26834_c0_g1_i1.p1  ORF type:complete len:190 (-),score=38.21 TRINITY_DN26834_c0_g1_i1:247-816(-)